MFHFSCSPDILEIQLPDTIEEAEDGQHAQILAEQFRGPMELQTPGFSHVQLLVVVADWEVNQEKKSIFLDAFSTSIFTLFKHLGSKYIQETQLTQSYAYYHIPSSTLSTFSTRSHTLTFYF